MANAVRSLSEDNVSFGKDAKGAAGRRASQACPGSVHGCAPPSGTLAEGASSLQDTHAH